MANNIPTSSITSESIIEDSKVFRFRDSNFVFFADYISIIDKDGRLDVTKKISKLLEKHEHFRKIIEQKATFILRHENPEDGNLNGKTLNYVVEMYKMYLIELQNIQAEIRAEIDSMIRQN